MSEPRYYVGVESAFADDWREVTPEALDRAVEAMRATGDALHQGCDCVTCSVDRHAALLAALAVLRSARCEVGQHQCRQHGNVDHDHAHEARTRNVQRTLLARHDAPNEQPADPGGNLLPLRTDAARRATEIATGTWARAICLTT